LLNVLNLRLLLDILNLRLLLDVLHLRGVSVLSCSSLTTNLLINELSLLSLLLLLFCLLFSHFLDFLLFICIFELFLFLFIYILFPFFTHFAPLFPYFLFGNKFLLLPSYISLKRDVSYLKQIFSLILTFFHPFSPPYLLYSFYRFFFPVIL